MLKKVLFSEKDEAGRNISGILRDEFSVSCTPLPESVLYLEAEPDSIKDADLLIVASRHKSESGTPSLTVHSPGNFKEAEAGGSSRQLAYAPAHYLSSAMHFLQSNPVAGYEACLEATHHGPTALRAPIIFVEVGSTEKEWRDLEACRAIAKTISYIATNEPEKIPAAIGFGGGHYCRKFSLVSDYALGHICPKYALKDLDTGMVEEMIKKTVPLPKHALLERKGMGPWKERTIKLLEETGLDVVQI